MWLEVKGMLRKLLYKEGRLVEWLADVALETSRHDEFTVLLVFEVGIRLLDGAVGMPVSPGPSFMSFWYIPLYTLPSAHVNTP